MRSAPKLPNVAGPGLPRRDSHSAPPSKSTAAPYPPARRRMVGAGHVEARSRVRFRGLAHPRRARGPEGKVFRVKGRKIWTTHAHLSNGAPCTRGPIQTHPSIAESPASSSISNHPGSPSNPFGWRPSPTRRSAKSSSTSRSARRQSARTVQRRVAGGDVVVNHERQMIWIMNWVEIQRGLGSVRESNTNQDDTPPARSSPNSARARRRRSAAGHGYRALNNELAGRPSPEAGISNSSVRRPCSVFGELAAAAGGPRSIDDADLFSNVRTRSRRPSTAGRPRSNATSSPSDCSDCRRDDDGLRPRRRRRRTQKAPAGFDIHAIPEGFLGACTDDPETSRPPSRSASCSPPTGCWPWPGRKNTAAAAVR